MALQTSNIQIRWTIFSKMA